MPTFPLTSTCDAAPCPTFLGRTGEGVGGAAVGFGPGTSVAKAAVEMMKILLSEE